MAKILLVEDELLIGMVMEEIISGLGHEVIGPFDSKMSAAPHLGGDIDLAILDITLVDGDVFPFAHTVAEMGIPFFFVSGSVITDKAFDEVPVLVKPVQEQQVATTIAALLEHA